MSKKKPLYTPPAMKNRWVMEFDSSVNMSSFIVQRMTPLTYDAQARKWKEMTIEFIELLGDSAFARMVGIAQDTLKRKPIVLKFIDEQGETYHKVYFVKYLVGEVNHDALDYGNEEVVMSRMVMTPIEVVFSEED